MPLSVVLPDHKRLNGIQLSKETSSGASLNWSVGVTGFAVATGGGVHGRLEKPDPECRHVLGRCLGITRWSVMEKRCTRSATFAGSCRNR